MNRNASGDRKDTAESLRESLENSLRGLQAFRDTLYRSGMREVREQYSAFTQTLLHQRGFALRNRRRDLDPHFAALAQTARECRDLLEHYYILFKLLSEIESTNPYQRFSEALQRTVGSVNLTSLEVSLLQLLVRHGRLSAARIVRETGQSEVVLAACWNDLCSYELVERIGWGRSVSYQLRSNLCQAVAEALLNGLAPAR